MNFSFSFYRCMLLLSFVGSISCNSQTNKSKNPATNKTVGGPCEGCEAIYEYGNKPLTPVDTLPLFEETEPKLKVTGRVYESDGKTPAGDVILYIYHTDRSGRYPKRGDETGWARRHGFIRGWARTDSTGRYTFYTFKPGTYPDRSEPAHIHITIKEPGINEYYLDDFVFKDDPLVTPEIRKRFTNRGSSGIMKPEMRNRILTIERDIILGLNIPGYE